MSLLAKASRPHPAPEPQRVRAAQAAHDGLAVAARRRPAPAALREVVVQAQHAVRISDERWCGRPVFERPSIAAALGLWDAVHAFTCLGPDPHPTGGPLLATALAAVNGVKNLLAANDFLLAQGAAVGAPRPDGVDRSPGDVRWAPPADVLATRETYAVARAQAATCLLLLGLLA